jgi:hypothetical protein
MVRRVARRPGGPSRRVSVKSTARRLGLAGNALQVAGLLVHHRESQVGWAMG